MLYTVVEVGVLIVHLALINMHEMFVNVAMLDGAECGREGFQV